MLSGNKRVCMRVGSCFALDNNTKQTASISLLVSLSCACDRGVLYEQRSSAQPFVQRMGISVLGGSLPESSFYMKASARLEVR